jgi:hypothetical protein
MQQVAGGRHRHGGGNASARRYIGNGPAFINDERRTADIGKVLCKPFRYRNFPGAARRPNALLQRQTINGSQIGLGNLYRSIGARRLSGSYPGGDLTGKCFFRSVGCFEKYDIDNDDAAERVQQMQRLSGRKVNQRRRIGYDEGRLDRGLVDHCPTIIKPWADVSASGFGLSDFQLSSALMMSSHIFLASPNSIMVLSKKNSSFSIPA